MKDGLVQQGCPNWRYIWHLSTAEIEQYLDQNEYADKAGAYGIQGAGALQLIRLMVTLQRGWLTSQHRCKNVQIKRK